MSIKNKIHWIFLRLIKFFAGLVPKDKELILFFAWFGQKYADNTKYPFGYMLSHSDYKVYWFTKNQQVYKELVSKKIPVVYSKDIKGIWMQLRAIMLVSTIQSSDFLQSLINKCILLDLDHGFPGKPVGLAQPTVTDEWRRFYYFSLKNVDFYQTASSRFVVDYASRCYDIKPDHFLFTNKPRIDVLFNSELQEEYIEQINNIKNNRKAIVYLPTHRACGKIKMPLMDILDLEKLQNICEKKNVVFLIKKHFYHRNEIEDLSMYPNIVDISQTNIDTQVLLSQTDVLVTDFSSCFNDYLALNRPIIFYAYDYDDYLKNERDYYWKYDKIDAGYTCQNKADFSKAIANIISDMNDSVHESGRKKMREVYFDKEVEMGTTRKVIATKIDQLIKGVYTPFDWNLKS